MWTKRDKRLEPLFVKPGSSHMEMANYFHFRNSYPDQTLSTMASNSLASSPTVLWKANSARRRRFGLFLFSRFSFH